MTFRVQAGDKNTGAIIESVSRNGQSQTMAQRYIPEITAGDKRILLIEGEPVSQALARVPADDDARGNLAAGASGVGVDLNERDRWICSQVGPQLAARGLLLVGLDVIGEYLTEINVTSPTCIRELEAIYGLDIAGAVLDAVEARLNAPAD